MEEDELLASGGDTHALLQHEVGVVGVIAPREVACQPSSIAAVAPLLLLVAREKENRGYMMTAARLPW